MTATIFICVLSTIIFCFSMRGLLAIASGARHTPAAWSARRHGFSGAAWRLARAYFVFALVLLALMSLAGVFSSYFELFTSMN